MSNGNKYNAFVAANALSISAKFQPYLLMASEELIFYIYRKFSLSVALTTIEIEGFGQKLYV